jgi:DNA-binding response OmpR family regulator
MDAETVLIVEDNADMRDYLRAHLEPYFALAEADNGQSGLERARELVPDLVLSDVMMPRLDGVDLCRALKTDPTTSHVPVLLLTARADVEDRIAGFDSGADAYLAKPFDAAELLVRVRALIDERRRLRAYYNRVALTHASPSATQEASAAGTTSPESPTAEPALSRRETAFLEKVSAVIEREYARPEFGVDQLAEALHLSRRQAHRKVLALTDTTPAVLLRRHRLAVAAERLRTEHDVSVKEVCFGVGFQSESSFGRLFREFYGNAPSGYREAANPST